MHKLYYKSGVFQASYIADVAQGMISFIISAKCVAFCILSVYQLYLENQTCNCAVLTSVENLRLDLEKLLTPRQEVLMV